MKEVSADQKSTPLVDWRMICRLKKCLVCRTICRSRFDLQIKKVFDLQIEELYAIDELQVEDVFDLQIKELSADGKTICQSKNCLETKELFDWQIEE